VDVDKEAEELYDDEPEEEEDEDDEDVDDEDDHDLRFCFLPGSTADEEGTGDADGCFLLCSERC
jgi:hypothetical protein